MGSPFLPASSPLASPFSNGSAPSVVPNLSGCHSDGQHYPALVSSALSSLTLRRQPPTATCRLQRAPDAPGLNLRPYTSSTCLLFSLSPFSGENSSPEAMGTLPGSSRIWNSVPKFRGGRLVSYRPVERQTSNRKSSQYRITVR